MTPGGFFWLWYVFPNFSFSVCLLDIYVPGGALALLRVDVMVAWVALALATPVYICLYTYLDAVIPNAYGISESPMFCCRRKPQKVSETTDDHFKRGHSVVCLNSDSIISIRNLSKHYGTLKAVDDLSLVVN